jgi:uncharacterized membrane protein
MQNPPPDQQGYGYGAPYGAPPPNAPMSPPPGGGGPRDKTSLGGLEANLASALGYPIGIVAILIVVMEKQNRFARFHALQALLLYAAWIVICIVLGILIAILSMISDFLGILGIFFPLIGLVWFAALLFCAYKAYQGEVFKLPVIGDIAEKFANQ